MTAQPETSHATHERETSWVGPGVRSNVMLAVYSLWLREMVRFWRQKGRFAGAIGSPLLIWIVLGAGFGSTFRLPDGASDGGYLKFFYPGIIVLTVMFTAIYSTISVIEDRQEGFLQGVLVAPISRVAVVMGKMLGGTTLAMLQGALLLVAAPLAGVHLGLGNIIASLGMLMLLAFALTGVGMVIAWAMDSSSGFHAVMNLLLMPLWMLSGAAFPYSGAHGVVRGVMAINPLTFGVDGLRLALGAPGAHFGWAICVIVSFAFAVIATWASVAIASRRARA